MALKDWVRAKSGESKTYPVVYRKKINGDNTLVIKYYSVFGNYDVQRNDYTIFSSTTKIKALAFAKSYMRTH